MEKDMGAISGSREPDPASGSGPVGFDPERGGYIDRLLPKPEAPDWRDVEAVTKWIETTRTRAFFGGARHAEISRAEAEALVAALAQR